MDIALLTSANFTELVWDAKLLVEAFSTLGLDAQLVVWDRPDFDWSQPKLALIHSTWDYHLRRAEFLSRLAKISSQTRLWNSVEVANWNSDKSYLKEVAETGIPVVPTLWLEQTGKAPDLAKLLTEQGWTNSVIKPAVSASAYGTLLVTPQTVERGQAHLEKLLADGTVLIQPYLPTLADYGERNLIFIDGKFSHCIKRPSQLLENGERLAGELEAIAPTKDELELAQKVLDCVGRRFEVLYARVDIVRDEAGSARLLEVELIEPSLMLEYRPSAAKELAKAVIKRLER